MPAVLPYLTRREGVLKTTIIDDLDLALARDQVSSKWIKVIHSPSQHLEPHSGHSCDGAAEGTIPITDSVGPS